MFSRPIKKPCILCRKVVEHWGRSMRRRRRHGIVCWSEQWLINREVWSQASDENRFSPPFLSPLTFLCSSSPLMSTFYYCWKGRRNTGWYMGNNLEVRRARVNVCIILAWQEWEENHTEVPSPCIFFFLSRFLIDRRDGFSGYRIGCLSFLLRQRNIVQLLPLLRDFKVCRPHGTY